MKTESKRIKLFLEILPFILLNLNYIKCSQICEFEYTNHVLILKNFDSFNQINFTSFHTVINATFINIKPSNRIILSTFDAHDLTLKVSNHNLIAIFFKLKGIEFEAVPFRSIQLADGYLYREIIWNFSNSDFAFYLNSTLIDAKLCNFSTFYKRISKYTNINIYDTTFLRSVKYLFLSETTSIKNKLCPLVFDASNLKLFTIKSLSDSLIAKKRLSFYPLPAQTDLDLFIFEFSISCYHLTLDENLLNVNIFKRLQTLDINGQIRLIKLDLFKSFTNLKVVNIKLQSINTILANSWFEYLNYGMVDIDLDNQFLIEKNIEKLLILTLFQMYANTTYYDYPNEDICLFRRFPHQKLVMPQLKPIYKSSCSCTELFLIQHSVYYSDEIHFYLYQTSSDYGFMMPFYHDIILDLRLTQCFNDSFRTYLENCNFQERFNKCEIESIGVNFRLDFYIDDWIILSDILSRLSLYLNPLFLLLSILSNIATILILSEKHIKKDLKNFYTYLLINSYSNIIYIILLTLGLFSGCRNQSDYCFPFYDSIIVQYSNKILFNFVKKSTETFSNLTYMSFILIRYIRITKTKNKILEKFSKMSHKTYLVVVIFLCLLINLYVYFEFEIFSNEKRLRTLTEDSSFQPEDYKNIFDTFLINLSKSETFLFHLFQYVKIFFSDLVMFFFSVYFDISLLIFIKQTQNRSISHTRSKKIPELRIRSMIVLNMLNFLFLRFPSDLMDFYGLIFNYEVIDSRISFNPSLVNYLVCRIFRFCENLNEVLNLLYLCSFLVQFFIFYRLDRNFKTSALKIISKISFKKS